MARRQETGGGLSTAEYLERQEVRMHLRNLQEMHNNAYKQRKDKWFEKNPEQQYFSPTLEETRKDCRLEEWLWYFVSRIFDRTPQQRFQDERHPSYGWNHKSNVHSIEEPCKEGCRFWNKEGRIEDIEVLEDYKDYNRYQEVFNVWSEQ